MIESTLLPRPLLSDKKMLKKKKKSPRKSENYVIDTKGDTQILSKADHVADFDLSQESLEEKGLVEDLFGRDTIQTQTPDVTYPPEAKKKREPAWVDEDEDEIRLCDVATTMRKSKKIKHSRETSETKYKDILHENFNRIHTSIPEWARLDRQIEQPDDSEKHVGLNLASKESGGGLPGRILNFRALKDLNGESRAEGAIITSIRFHAEHQVGLVAGSKDERLGCASLFKVDGRTNPKIQSIKFPKFPVKCAQFLPDGKRFVVGSNLYGHIFIYDMEAGKRSHIPWNKSRERQSMKHFEVSHNGKMVVFIGSGGKLHLFDSDTLSHIHTMQVPCEVKDLDFNRDGTQMFTHGDNGQVYVFDMERRACVHNFYDDGCVEGTSIAVSPDNRLLACGSSSGIVNLYETSSLVKIDPRPIKIISNLVTKITSLAFNETSEILALSSDAKPSAIKMMHIPTLSIFENFPNPKNQYIQRVQNVNFSPQSGYLAAGNNRGSALLYRLHHYGSY